MQGWQIQTVFGVFIPWPCLSKAMLQTCEEEGSLAELITTISLCVNKEAICNLSLDRVLFLRLKGLPPCPTPSISVPSTAHKVIYHVLELWLSATQLRWGCEPLCFYFSCSLTSADSGWGQDPRKLRIVWLSLKLLHFLKFVPWCKGKPI